MASRPSRRSRPVIGITCDFEQGRRNRAFIYEDYIDAIEEAGGAPVLLPPLDGAGSLDPVLAGLRAIVLTGGDDYSPHLYGQRVHPGIVLVAGRRQRFDLALAQRVLDGRWPVLGICNGCQLMNIARGGSLIQDIESQRPDALPHRARPGRKWHAVDVVDGTRLRALLGRTRVRVGSYHHQAVRRLGRGLRVAARSPDGIIEAIEDRRHFILGVQWHPELELERRYHQALFKAFVEEAAKR